MNLGISVELWNLLRNLLQMLVLGPLIIFLPLALQSFLIKRSLKFGSPVRLSRDGVERWFPGHVGVWGHRESGSRSMQRYGRICMHIVILLIVRGSGTYLAFRSGSQMSKIIRNREVKVMASSTVDPDTFHSTDWPPGVSAVFMYSKILNREAACSIRKGDDILIRAYDHSTAGCIENASPILIQDCFAGKSKTGKNCSSPFKLEGESEWVRDTISASMASTSYNQFRNISKFSYGVFRFAPRKWHFGNVEGKSVEITGGLSVACYSDTSDSAKINPGKELAPQILGWCIARFRDQVLIFEHFRTALKTNRRIYGPFSSGTVAETQSIGGMRKLVSGVELRTTGFGIRLSPLKSTRNDEKSEFMLPFFLRDGEVLSRAASALGPSVAHAAAEALSTLMAKGGLSNDTETKRIDVVTGMNLTATVGIDAVIIFAGSTIILSCLFLVLQHFGRLRDKEGRWGISLEMGDILNRIRDEVDNGEACRKPAPGGVLLQYTTDGVKHHIGFKSIGEQAVPSERDNLRWSIPGYA